MRLTLRTLLAFRDRTMSEDQREKLRERVDSSELAQAVLRRLDHLGRAAHVGSELMELDPNVPAHYLDCLLTEEGVRRVEEAAFEHDELLAEIGDCHAILANYDPLSSPASKSLATRICRDLVPHSHRVNVTSDSAAHRTDPGAGEREIIQVQATAPVAAKRSRFHGWYSAATSAVVNGLLLFVLSCISVHMAHKTQPIELNLQGAEQLTDVEYSFPEELDLEIETENFAAAELDAASTEPSSTVIDRHFFEDINGLPSAATALTGFSDVSEIGAFADGSGSPSDSVRYYGHDYAARNVVYIVDASGSMRGPRFQQACEELIYSLNRLQPTQRFAVLFFSGHRVRAFPHGSKLFPATRRNLRKVEQFIRNTVPHSGTEPSEALKNALRRHPDMIFFLSDGEIPNEAVVDARHANRDEVMINTIGFKSRFAADLLRQLAIENRGEYRFVP